MDDKHFISHEEHGFKQTFEHVKKSVKNLCYMKRLESVIDKTFNQSD